MPTKKPAPKKTAAKKTAKPARKGGGISTQDGPGPRKPPKPQ